MPDTVKGLDLFDPQPSDQAAPAVTRAQDIFSSAYSDQEQVTPSAPSVAEKFRTGLSVVSHGVLGSVRNIPKSAWRMAVLVVGAFVVIGLIVWGCIILYRVTEQPVATPAKQQAEPTPDASKQQAKPIKQKQVAQPQNKQTAQPQKKQSAPAAKPKLRSTGQKVPPLYVD